MPRAISPSMSPQENIELNIPAPRGNTPTAPARGAAPAGRGTPAPARGATPTPVDRLVKLRELLAASNLPLSKEQETGLTALLNAEIPVMRQSLQKRIGELQGSPAAVSYTHLRAHETPE